MGGGGCRSGRLKSTTTQRGVVGSRVSQKGSIDKSEAVPKSCQLDQYWWSYHHLWVVKSGGGNGEKRGICARQQQLNQILSKQDKKRMAELL